ncbi:MAG: hypothetical protein K2X93_08020 [Candidatus Obscuribacterales bacterium]|nr:hypothetical protein [Candidatus Obscuribacterales bacterium]
MCDSTSQLFFLDENVDLLERIRAMEDSMQAHAPQRTNKLQVLEMATTTLRLVTATRDDLRAETKRLEELLGEIFKEQDGAWNQLTNAVVAGDESAMTKSSELFVDRGLAYSRIRPQMLRSKEALREADDNVRFAQQEVDAAINALERFEMSIAMRLMASSPCIPIPPNW